jgi:hypothetical protein
LERPRVGEVGEVLCQRDQHENLGGGGHE